MGSALHLGGRKKKESDNKQGRTAKSILCDAPETWKTDDPLSIPRFLPPSTSLHLNDLTPCRKLVCAECISTAIRASDGPSCSNIHPITPTTFTPASDVALEVCCCFAPPAQQEHHDSILAHSRAGPLQSPPTSAESAKVVQRLLHTPSTESQPVIQLARSSIDIKNIIPLSLVRVNSPRVSSSNASRWTIKRKSSQMSSVREFISSGS